MSALIPLALNYDPEKSSWCFYSKEQTAARYQTLYWGASLTPVSMRVCHDLQSPPGALPMKAMVAWGNRPVLGPLIGILSAENPDGSLKGNFNNYKALMEAGQKIGSLVFAFTPSAVDWNKKIIRGKFFNPNNNKWVTCSFPFPNVVYNRIQDREHENKESSQSCIQRFLSLPGVTLYNPGFFNKGEIISTLSTSAKIKRYLPETIPLLSKADLVHMLKRHKALYLKPTDSRLGSGIMRVVKSESKKPYTMHYYAEDKHLKQYSGHTINRLWNKIVQQMIPSPYILQQAIPLAVVSTCPFDCRVLVQKNHRGLWKISGLGIRIAAHAQSITTHVPRGGRLGSPEDVLQQAFPRQKPAQIAKRVHRLCIAIAKKLEPHYHHLAEMSVDVGLDRHGHPWMFEANAKPMKFDEPEIREKQLGQVIRYAQFLTFKRFSR
jgi:hypothetical protein